MAVPAMFQGRFAYHFTSLENLESVLRAGLLCTNEKNRLGITHANVADAGIQGRRHTMAVPCVPNTVVHDYVPFYFSKKTPMQLGVINRKNLDQELVIYLAIRINVMDSRQGVVFTDASANTQIPPRFFLGTDSHMLEQLNWQAIDSNKWGCPNDEYRHQKMAELLIPNSVLMREIDHIVVWNDWIAEEAKKIFEKVGVNCPPIRFDGDHYFTAFYDNSRRTIVTGPIFLKKYVQDSIDKIDSCGYRNVRFSSLRAMLLAVRANFDVIKELADINGLGADYGPHHDDVGTHSRRVAALVVGQPEYQLLSEDNKVIVELAAYLHDIGKGPKTRWENSTMNQADNDHARKSLPMLERIFLEDVAKIDRDSLRKLVTLIVYDDIFGDVVARGRNKQQLFDIITSADDVLMLAALGKSDMSAIDPGWLWLHNQAIENLKGEAFAYLGIS